MCGNGRQLQNQIMHFLGGIKVFVLRSVTKVTIVGTCYQCWGLFLHTNMLHTLNMNFFFM